MTFATITRAKLASSSGYLDADGAPSEKAIAQLLRDALGRWGLCPRRALFKHARDQLRAGDVPTDNIPGVFQRLVALGECDEVFVGHEIYIVPAEPRWVCCGDRSAVLLGVAAIPRETPRIATLSTTDVAVRVQLENEGQAAALTACGVREVSLEEWLHPLGLLPHAARRAGDAIRSDLCNLSAYWDSLEADIVEDGVLLGPDAKVRAVAGEVGGFFGRYSATAVEGRWREDVSNGVWCAYRRSYGENHWLPILLSVDGEERRSLDLFDDDEWRWALLARSRAIGPPEMLRRERETVAVTWPLPTQLRAAMDLIGFPIASWRWRVGADAPDLWGLLK